MMSKGVKTIYLTTYHVTTQALARTAATARAVKVVKCVARIAGVQITASMQFWDVHVVLPAKRIARASFQAKLAQNVAIVYIPNLKAPSVSILGSQGDSIFNYSLRRRQFVPQPLVCLRMKKSQ